MKYLYRLFFFLLIVSTVFAQDEFLVNTYMDSTQRDPQIDRDANGNYVVVWNSEAQVDANSMGDIYLQLYNYNDEKTGLEEMVNNITEGNQEKPALSMNNNGDFVIVWSSFTDFNSIYDVKAKLYKNNLPVSNEFLVNTTTLHSQTNPEIAMNDDGSFVILWESWYQDGSNKGIYGQRFDKDGNKTGTEFQVNTTTEYSQARPTMKYMPDNGFIAIWESWKQDIATPSGYGIFGQLFNSDGNKIGNEFQINTYTNDYQWFGDVEVFEDNSFTVVWCSWEQDGDDGGIYLQRFNSQAEKVGNEIQVNETVLHYQWLPRIAKLENDNFAIIWSSWKQDGSREGVYARFLNSDGEKISFERQVNDYTESFQWEPDLIAGSGNEILVVWSSWGQYQKDYEIIGKRVQPVIPQGAVKPGSYVHTGRTTSQILVHVMDIAALTGNQYEISFRIQSEDSVYATIENLNTMQTIIADFPVDKGEGVFYLTPTFEGVAVEFIPEFDFKLDQENSYFLNNSGSNLMFEVTLPTAGAQKLAPIDISLIWGSPDTLSNGIYAAPLDTAIGTDGVRDVVLPFKAWNIIDDQKIDMLIVEQDVIENNRWDPGERIIFLTPPPYRTSSSNTHAQLNTILPQEEILTPNIGDSNFVFTRRPFKAEDKFIFETKTENITAAKESVFTPPEEFNLYQNYPNPFNPTTTISYSIPFSSRVKLTIFNVLGQRIRKIVDKIHDKGQYKILFNGSSLASGIYFYSIEFDNRIITKKLILIK